MGICLIGYTPCVYGRASLILHKGNMLMRIQDINSLEELAEAIDINLGYLMRLINQKRNSFYRHKIIPKKNGGQREIYVPNKEILYILKKLNQILINSFNPHFAAYGFIKEKSILDNAEKHIGKKYLLNIDLKDFFPSISSGRIYSMFINYFKRPSNVASVLTNLCCHANGFLPQGAPTSPTISNILCKSLDWDLYNLAKEGYEITYTRYADDITFSSNYLFSSKFVTDTSGEVNISSELESIIRKNGFEINYDKVRLQNNNQHQEVTGIVVNEKLNVNRKYIRKIRAILHSIETNLNNLSIPIKKFTESSLTGNTLFDMFRSLKGMIEYVGMVRGKENAIFKNLAIRFNDLIPLTEVDNIKLINYFSNNKFTFLVPENDVKLLGSDGTKFSFPDCGKYEGVNKLELNYGQGSAFLIKGIGIISNYHVFEFVTDGLVLGGKPDFNEYFIELSLIDDFEKKIKAKIAKYSVENDLILLIPEDTSLLENGYEIFVDDYSNGDKITLLGYPDYHPGDQLKAEHGEIIRSIKGKKRYEVSQTIFGGNSGGPILDSNNKVIGVATEGRGNHINEMVPIDYIHNLINVKYTPYFE